MQTERVTEIFDNLVKLSIDLPTDPASMGPEYLQEKVSVCRNYLNEASHYFQELLREKTLLNMRLEALKTAYSISSDELMANDQRVKGQPHIKDREAMINVILSTERTEISGIETDLRNLDHVEKVIRLRKQELDNTMSALRLQRSLLGDDLKNGGFYGDESNVSRGKKLPGFDPGEDSDTSSFDDIVAEAEAELAQEIKAATEPKAVAVPAPEPAPVPEEKQETSLEDELDLLISGGGVDETPTVSTKSLQVVVKKPELPNISDDDIDAEMLDFLSDSA